MSEEKLRLDNYMEEVTQELAEKTPALQKLRKDHDQAVSNCNQLTTKLNSLFEECETLNLESEDSVRQFKASERENVRLKQLAGDLGRQIKVSNVVEPPSDGQVLVHQIYNCFVVLGFASCLSESTIQSLFQGPGFVLVSSKAVVTTVQLTNSQNPP